ncbi:hypothetical protein LTR37_013820 [Vermiconidia calcicola]|uniref:Uncharacterized protein n=1 Tax=Vermiconidia calcicola TaxID=1690605 RepID=A0ACC3MWP2_9PEZI|nr:hypothetical protein LTR37_013820 [Vermiconidia calcicola]
MLEHDIPIPKGWQSAWLHRTLPALQWYTTIASSASSSSVEARSDWLPTQRFTARYFGHKKTQRIAKGHFFIANIYIVHALVIAVVDAVLCAGALSNDVAAEPELWTRDAILEVALYCGFLLVVFLATFFLVPLLQMLAVTSFLARLKGTGDLTDFIPEARFLSTHIAQMWCMMAFFGVSWWSPDNDSNSFWRHVMLQACIGSAAAWLEASFVFNFRSENLEDVRVAAGGVQQILSMFTKTVKAAHTNEKAALLPTHEKTAPHTER